MSTRVSPWWTRAAVAGVVALVSGCTEAADPFQATGPRFASSNGMTYDYGSSVTATGNPGEVRLESFSQGIDNVDSHGTSASYDIDMLCDGTYESTDQSMGSSDAFGTDVALVSLTLQGSAPYAVRVHGTHVFNPYSGDLIAVEYSSATGCITS